MSTTVHFWPGPIFQILASVCFNRKLNLYDILEINCLDIKQLGLEPFSRTFSMSRSKTLLI